MPNFGPNFAREFRMPSNERRIIIGAHVIGAWLMQEVVAHLATVSPQKPYSFDNELDNSAQSFMSILRDNEFIAARTSMLSIAPDSNVHHAREQMGLTTKTLQSGIGNTYVLPNQDFIAALHYLEKNEIGEKIDAQLELTELVQPCRNDFIEFYMDRIERTLAIQGIKTNIREPMRYAIFDSEYWLNTD